MRALDGDGTGGDGVDSVDAELRGAVDGPGPVVLLGSDTGALAALILAGRLVAAGVPVAGIVAAGLPARGDEPALVSLNWEAELDARTACPVHRSRLSEDITLRPGELLTAQPSPAAWASLDAGTDVPALVIHGRADLISPVADVAALVRRLPRARLVTVAGGRHDVLNDVHHRSVAAQVVSFLELLRAGADLTEIVRVEDGSSW